jgi:hypothetical protein
LGLSKAKDVCNCADGIMFKREEEEQERFVGSDSCAIIAARFGRKRHLLGSRGLIGC